MSIRIRLIFLSILILVILISRSLQSYELQQDYSEYSSFIEEIIKEYPLAFEGKEYYHYYLTEKIEDSKNDLYLTYIISSILVLSLGTNLLWTMYQSITHLLNTFKNLHDGEIKSLKEKNEFHQITYFLEHFVERTKEMKQRLSEHKNELYKKLYFDEVTQLPNRNKLFIDIEDKKDITVALLNIDGFHYINDNYGENFGDFVLKKLADELLSNCSQDVNIYKLHADEYAIVFQEKSDEKIEKCIKKIMLRISQKTFFDTSFSTTLNLTIGLGSNLQKADMALKKAKKTQQPILNFDEHIELKKYYSETLLWKNKLKNLLEEDRLIPFFQPIVNLDTLEIIKYEALCRLKDKNGTIIAPDTFMHIAKTSRLYSQITKMMVTKAFEIFSDKSYQVSINLSIEDILNPETVLFIEKMIEHYGMQGKVEFEITESEKIYDFERVNNFINHFKSKYKVSFAIDDFGNGYSNFEYLLKLNVDIVKIDGSLTRNFLNDSKKISLLKYISYFSQELNIKTTAEFVETQEMVNELKKYGITHGQGYYFAKPNEFVS